MQELRDFFFLNQELFQKQVKESYILYLFIFFFKGSQERNQGTFFKMENPEIPSQSLEEPTENGVDCVFSRDNADMVYMLAQSWSRSAQYMLI